MGSRFPANQQILCFRTNRAYGPPATGSLRRNGLRLGSGRFTRRLVSDCQTLYEIPGSFALGYFLFSLSMKSGFVAVDSGHSKLLFVGLTH